MIDLGVLREDPLLVILGDCLEVMKTFPDNSVDAVVTDPPYGLEFMGKEWDSFRVDPRTARWTAERSGGAGAGISQANWNKGEKGTVLPSFHKRRTTRMCRTCGKRDAFANPHKCGDAADWVTIPVDSVPIEARAFENWCGQWALEAIRVLKPGGHLLAFGGTRTFHRLTVALEDAGFDIRDCLMWLYGSGFPKSHDVSKAFDKAAGVEREVLGMRHVTRNIGEVRPVHEQAGHGTEVPITEPVTDEAKQWNGWGSALKPAWEPIVMAQKPMEGTYVENLRKWGVGALNIDGSRIGGGGGTTRSEQAPYPKNADGTEDRSGSWARTGHDILDTGAGRWPANFMLSHTPDCVELGTRRIEASGMFPTRRSSPQATSFGVGRPTEGGARPSGDGDGLETIASWACVPTCPVLMLDTEAGDRPSTLTGRADPSARHANPSSVETHAGSFGFLDGIGGAPVYADGGGPSRFFYTAKASRADRGKGNTHPTVKPVEIMRYLVRLVTPPAGLVLDPFAGSGTTGQAALSAGFRCVLVEKSPEYVEGIRTWRAAMQLGHGLG